MLDRKVMQVLDDIEGALIDLEMKSPRISIIEMDNLRNYITNELVPISGMTNEYMVIDTPVHGMTKTLYLKTLLTSGTYKFVFSLYDGTAFIGDMSQYIIIK